MTHAVKEGFDTRRMVEAIASGQIIERYDEESRVLVCGLVYLLGTVELYLHVVCDYSDPCYVEFVTAYIPDETLWGMPPARRKRKGK